MLRNYAIPQDESIDISNDSTYESIEVPIQVIKNSLSEIRNVTNEKSHVPILLPQILKKSKVSSKQHCCTRHRGGLKNISVKRTNFLASFFFLWRRFLFKKSPYSIMVTRNPDWSAEIL